MSENDEEVIRMLKNGEEELRKVLEALPPSEELSEDERKQVRDALMQVGEAMDDAKAAIEQALGHKFKG